MNTLGLNFLGLYFDSPLMNASGCFGYGIDYADCFDPNILGAVVLKGLTLQAREGNSGVRIAETPSGMLNCVGLENVGFNSFEKEVLPAIRKKLRLPLVANINGTTVPEYTELAEKVSALADIAAVELNISCPNVKAGGMAFGIDPGRTAEVVRSVRKVCCKPLIVKLSPNVTDIRIFAEIAEDEGADALSLINTVSGMAIDIRTRKPLLGNITGGLSGAAVKPIALQMIYQVSQITSIPIIGMGGISSPEDALEFIFAGACTIAIGSALFKNPLAAVEITEGLRLYCEENKTHITDLIGCSHPDSGILYKGKLSDKIQRR